MRISDSRNINISLENIYVIECLKIFDPTFWGKELWNRQFCNGPIRYSRRNVCDKCNVEISRFL